MPPETLTTESAEEVIVPEHQVAFESLKEMLAATEPGELRWLNLKLAAHRAMALHGEISKPDAAAQLALLPDDERLFKKPRLGLLVTVAGAASYAYAKLRIAKAIKEDTKARLPEALFNDAKAHRKHMLDVADYNVGHLPEVSLTLKDIRAGTGYLDLANDLFCLGQLFIEHRAILKKDQNKYNASDAQRAFDLDKQIVQALDATKEGQIARWLDQSVRVATLLRATYEDIAQTGRWLLRYTASPEALDARFPSLFVGLGGRSTKKSPQAT